MRGRINNESDLSGGQDEKINAFWLDMHSFAVMAAGLFPEQFSYSFHTGLLANDGGPQDRKCVSALWYTKCVCVSRLIGYLECTSKRRILRHTMRHTY